MNLTFEGAYFFVGLQRGEFVVIRGCGGGVTLPHY